MLAKQPKVLVFLGEKPTDIKTKGTYDFGKEIQSITLTFLTLFCDQQSELV
jgi:hypothetical protein